MTRDDDDDRYMDYAALSAYSSLSRAVLLKATKDPIHPLPVYYLGGQCRRTTRALFRKSDFDTWLRTQTAAVTQQQETDQVLQAARGLRGWPRLSRRR